MTTIQTHVCDDSKALIMQCTVNECTNMDSSFRIRHHFYSLLILCIVFY